MPNGGIGYHPSAATASARQAAVAARRRVTPTPTPTPTPRRAGGASAGLEAYLSGIPAASFDVASPYALPTWWKPTPEPPSWLGTAGAAFLGGLPFGSQLGLGQTPTQTWTSSPGPPPPPTLVSEPTPTPTPTTTTEGAAQELTFISDVGWGYWYQDQYGEWHFNLVTPVSEAQAGMSEYEQAYLEYQQQLLAMQQAQQEAQEVEERRQHLAALVADPRRWIELAAYTEKPPTVPEWLSPLYEGQVAAGAPLEEAAAVGDMPLLSKQWWNRLSPAEREQLMGYMTWINQDPEKWMSDLWWMGGQRPFGMGRQFAPFRQYG